MTDRPILFSAPMVLALLAGRKTQTRRLAAGSTKPIGGDDLLWRPSPWRKVQPGDRLWVKETWAEVGAGDPGIPIYRADYPACVPAGVENIPPAEQVKWRVSIHCARRLSRLTLTVTDVRAQRLQEISEEDAEAESLWRGRARRNLWWHSPTACRLLEPYRSHKDAFADLWDSLHGPGAWDANPEVVALTFTVAQRNIDAA